MVNVMKPVTTPYLFTIFHAYTRRCLTATKNSEKKSEEKKKMCKFYFCRSIYETKSDFQKYFYVTKMGREIGIWMKIRTRSLTRWTILIFSFLFFSMNSLKSEGKFLYISQRNLKLDSRQLLWLAIQRWLTTMCRRLFRVLTTTKMRRHLNRTCTMVCYTSRAHIPTHMH